MTTLVKSCIKWECTLRNKCKLYFVQHAQIYFAPPEHSEHCHSYTPITEKRDDPSE